jgi:hypothetical protein
MCKRSTLGYARKETGIGELLREVGGGELLDASTHGARATMVPPSDGLRSLVKRLVLFAVVLLAAGLNLFSFAIGTGARWAATLVVPPPAMGRKRLEKAQE